MDTVSALIPGVVIKPEDKGVCREVGEGERADRPVKGDGLSVADAPIVSPLSLIGDAPNCDPRVTIERGAYERERQRVRGRARYDVDRPARALPVLRGLDRVCPRFRHGKGYCPRACLCLQGGAALFERDGRAGWRGYVDSRRVERQGDRVAIDYANRFRVGGLPGERCLYRPRPGLRELEGTRAGGGGRPRDRPAPLCRRDRRARLDRDDEGEARPRRSPGCVCSSYHALHRLFTFDNRERDSAARLFCRVNCYRPSPGEGDRGEIAARGLRHAESDLRDVISRYPGARDNGGERVARIGGAIRPRRGRDRDVLENLYLRVPGMRM